MVADIHSLRTGVLNLIVREAGGHESKLDEADSPFLVNRKGPDVAGTGVPTLDQIGRAHV